MKKSNKFISLVLSTLTLTSAMTLSACTSNQTVKEKPTDESSKQIIGTWQTEKINERPVIDQSSVQLVFLSESKFSGSASCNQISSSYTLGGNKKMQILSPFAMTRKMCSPAVMKQETKFVSAIEQIKHYQIKKNLLYLYNRDSELILTARKVR